ncbi:MAG: metallophosphoesterase [Propionicimonas sp.]|nr:metallophosphoesterase [Propionicimonas sp.]
MRFVASADWQLGMTAHFLDDQARPRFHQARLEAVRRIGQVAEQHEASFVVVCGDVFETNQLDRAIVAQVFEELRAFTMPVVLVPGNHDPLDAASIYDSPAFADKRPGHVHVLRDSDPFEVVPGAQVVGAPWFSKRPEEDLVARACAPLEPAPPQVVRVIAGHGAVSTLNPDRESLATIDVSSLRDVLDSGRAHVAVLGDRHGTYQVCPRVWYPGTPEVTARREVDPGNVLVVDVDPATGTTAAEKVRVGNWSFLEIEERLDSAADVDLLGQRLMALPDKDRTALWLSLSGTLTLTAKARLDAVVDEARDLFARVDYWQRHTDLAVVPDGHDFADLRLGGFAEAALDELRQQATGDGEGAQTAQDALGLLYRFAGAGR